MVKSTGVGGGVGSSSKLVPLRYLFNALCFVGWLCYNWVIVLSSFMFLYIRVDLSGCVQGGGGELRYKLINGLICLISTFVLLGWAVLSLTDVLL